MRYFILLFFVATLAATAIKTTHKFEGTIFYPPDRSIPFTVDFNGTVILLPQSVAADLPSLCATFPSITSDADMWQWQLDLNKQGCGIVLNDPEYRTMWVF